MARPRMSATSRDPEEWARKTEEARRVREVVAKEVAAVVAEQVEELLIAGDSMGGRGRVAVALEHVVTAERRGDKGAMRAATIELAVAGAAWTAALDYVPPEYTPKGNGRHPETDVA